MPLLPRNLTLGPRVATPPLTLLDKTLLVVPPKMTVALPVSVAGELVASPRDTESYVEPLVAPINSVPFRVTVFFKTSVTPLLVILLIVPLTVTPSRVLVVPGPIRDTNPAPVIVIIPPKILPALSVKVASFNVILPAVSERLLVTVSV